MKLSSSLSLKYVCLIDIATNRSAQIKTWESLSIFNNSFSPFFLTHGQVQTISNVFLAEVFCLISLPIAFAVCCCSVAKSQLTLCDPMDYIAHQAPLSMEFSRQEYWSGLPFPFPGDLYDPRKPKAPTLAGRFFTIEPLRKPTYSFIVPQIYLLQGHQSDFPETKLSQMNFCFKVLPLLPLTR